MPVEKSDSDNTFTTAAYGGHGWSPRTLTHRQELGTIWRTCGIDSEWQTLKAVLLHRPGDELLVAQTNPDGAQMLAPLDIERAQDEHDTLARCYEHLGIEVRYVAPEEACPPNQMFSADLFAMTPHGAILARPASTVRAGEERWVARRLAALGIPILMTVTGSGTFEGADMMWVDENCVLIGHGHRTNQSAIDQINDLLARLQIELTAVDMPYGTMHLMGMLRIADRDLAIAWPRRTPSRAVQVLREKGYEVVFPPFTDDRNEYRGMNFVTLGPRRILMVEGLHSVQAFFEKHGIECITTPTEELSKAAGNVGCLTGILERAKSGS